MAVLIIAPQRDEHAVAVKSHLERMGNEADVLDTSLFPEAARLAMQYKCCNNQRSLRLEVQGRVLELDRYGSVWWRRPQMARLSEQMLRQSHRAFAANEINEAMAGLWQTMDAAWINDPARDMIAGRKAYQLKVAQEVGLRIPATLITNDPAEARRFVDARGYREIAYKSFSSTEEEWRETRLLREGELHLLDQVQHAPVIFQHYVEARYDLRITAVGDELFPAAIHSQQTEYKVDSRIDIGSAKVEAVEIPDEVEDRLLELKRRLGLVFGAIDMRLTPQGDYVFLEINPAGQFMYIEAATGLPLAKAMAEELHGLDRRSGEDKGNRRFPSGMTNKKSNGDGDGDADSLWG
jgi:glutathione synthase/RimK-type ligase-like ATP-grasp enzyme